MAELIEYDRAEARVRAVFDDIKAARGLDDVNNFWKALAHDPDSLERIWRELKTVMAPGAVDSLTKELVYLAVSAANGCGYCVASHTAAARAKGASEAMLAEVRAVAAMACQTNALANALAVPIDGTFKAPKP